MTRPIDQASRAGSRLLSALSASSVLLAATAASGEEAATQLPAVDVRGVADRQVPELSPVSPEATRPVSILTGAAIADFAPKFADFGTLANLLPSFVSSAPNGNGFDAAKSITLRGFPDGQFNVSLDGIPFADPDGFGHHSTSIFPASSIGGLSIDRSPGSGNSLGYSGTGGTLNITSLALPATTAAEGYGAYGSFGTAQVGTLLHTAAPTEDGQTGLLLNAQHLQSDGAMANSFGRRDDVLLKSESRIAGLKLTLLYTYDNYHYFNPPSVTTDQLASLGSGAGLSLNPASPDYNEYAKTDRTADIGYARLEAQPADNLLLSETAYTYAYRNTGLSSNGDITLAKSYQVGKGFGVAATDIGGKLSNTSYRTFGNILQATREDGVGTLLAGLWVEHSHLEGGRNAIDLTTGAQYNANAKAGSSVLYQYHSTLDTIAPYADYVWKATQDLIVRGGLRYQNVERGFDASVVPTSRPATDGEITRKVHNVLPSLEANYAVVPSTHVYLQWAKGALVPNQSYFYTNTPALGNQAEPQTSQAFQGGVVLTAGPVNAMIDAYQVDLRNYVSQITDANNNTLFVNDGRVRYRGLEFEGNVDLGLGFAAIANGSVIRAEFRNDGIATATQRAGDTIPLVPSYTGLVGLLYRRGPWTGSVLAKLIGTEYQGAGGSSDGNDRRVTPYHYINLTLTRQLNDLLGGHGAALGFQINNVENRDADHGLGRSGRGRAQRAAAGQRAGPPQLHGVRARRTVKHDKTPTSLGNREEGDPRPPPSFRFDITRRGRARIAPPPGPFRAQTSVRPWALLEHHPRHPPCPPPDPS